MEYWPSPHLRLLGPPSTHQRGVLHEAVFLMLHHHRISPNKQRHFSVDAFPAYFATEGVLAPRYTRTRPSLVLLASTLSLFCFSNPSSFSNSINLTQL
ncbi:hypothetical protein BHE74_00035214 [Ensete ventricosum]|nr:hypothetical protein BHE74_00035214 [Ensete ventricosum]